MDSTPCETCHVTPCCCILTDGKFPVELVGSPTSEVLRFLSDQFRKFAEEVTGGTPEDGYTYAAQWLDWWADDVGKTESRRCRECGECERQHHPPAAQFVTDPVNEWDCARCGHRVYRH